MALLVSLLLLWWAQQCGELVQRLESMQAELADAQTEIETLKSELAKAHLHTQAGNYSSLCFFLHCRFWWS